MFYKIEYFCKIHSGQDLFSLKSIPSTPWMLYCINNEKRSGLHVVVEC